MIAYYKCHISHIRNFCANWGSITKLCLRTREGFTEEVMVELSFWWLSCLLLRPLKDCHSAFMHAVGNQGAWHASTVHIEPYDSPTMAESVYKWDWADQCANHISPGRSCGCYIEYNDIINGLDSVPALLVCSLSFYIFYFSHLHSPAFLGHVG